MFQILFVALMALLLGIAFCLWGYRLFLVMLPIWGFFAGLWIGAEATALIFGGGFLASVTGLVVGAVLGILAAIFSYLFYIFGVAFVAAGFGAAIGAGLMRAIGFDATLLIGAVALGAAIVAAVLTFRFNLQKYVIIAITAIGGANAVVLSFLLVLGRVTVQQLQTEGSSIRPIIQDSWFWLLVWAAIAAAGIFYQVRHNRTYAFAKDRYVEGWG